MSFGGSDYDAIMELAVAEATAAGGVQEMTKVWVGWVMGITPVRHARSCSPCLGRDQLGTR